MYTRAELKVLTEIYLEHQKGRREIALSTLSRWILGNDKVLPALVLEGKDCMASAAEITSGWFDANWPTELEWPKQIPRRDRKYRCPAPMPKQVVIKGVVYTATFP